jgi:hypothetical protein
MGSYLVHADLATIDAIDGAVTAKAKLLADVLPDAAHLRTDDARVEGHGPVTEAWVRNLLGPHAKFTIPYHQSGASGSATTHP